MKLVTIDRNGTYSLGVATDAGIIDVAAAANGGGEPTSIEAYLAGGDAAHSALQALVGTATAQPASGFKLGPCVPNPGKILCIGLNYRAHAIESGAAIPTSPVLFSKFNNSVAAHLDNVPLPAEMSSQYDYEAELGVVIGKTARNVSVEDALSYVAGYCNIDDVSARDLQTRTSQWLLGKSLDAFLPHGPYLVTSDEVGDPQTLQVQCRVNGKTLQNSNTADMIFSVAEIIAYTTKYFSLEPGDIISTGTPEGVAMGRPDKPWLKPGDVVEIEVDKLGILSNTMI